ncbi:hypothetical protein IV203_030638 [Nitzschia inconspicua]|uniref:Uncharacterized protein n=1 Tax=Nitzschia inconspicua TaxID=303405 RepID=A0A9K3KP26_9STRA|nr:hypothetical protein IV203_015975 [Nitzschia inconspicua]KAG7367895.1 hypothetical protein IV203_030638 [Nitzschia inconspicua]
MTTSMNPMVHLKHAWDNTHSVWGKLTIVLFYVFIWLNIIMAFLSVVWPNWMGCACFWKKESEYASASMVNLMQGQNLFALGFFLYADRGGIRLWNVSMVFVIAVVYSWFAWIWAKNWEMMEGAPKHCNDHGMVTMILVGVVWIAISWIFAFLEHRAGHSGGGAGGTTNESTPLNA